MRITASVLCVLTLYGCATTLPPSRDVDNYVPPSEIFSAQASLSEAGAPEAPRPTGELNRQIEEVRQRMERWEDALRGGFPASPVWDPDPLRLAEFGGAAKDPAAVAPALSGTFSLLTVETLAWLRSPSIAAAEKNLRAAVRALDQATNLDEVMARYAPFTGSGSGQEMAWPSPGVTALKGEAAHQEAVIASLDLQIARRDTLFQARSAFWDLVYAFHSLQVGKESLGIALTLEGTAESRYRSGKSPLSDFTRAQIRRLEQETRLKTLEEEVGNGHARLREVLDLPPSTPIGRPEEKTMTAELPSVEQLLTQAAAHRQEIQRFRAEESRLTAMIEMGETEIPTLLTLWTSRYPERDVQTAGTAAALPPFPLMAEPGSTERPTAPFTGLADAYLREARLRVEAIREEKRKEEARTAFLVREAWYAADRAAREGVLYTDQVLPLSILTYDATLKAYEAGSTSLSAVLEAYEERLSAALAVERSRTDLGIAAAMVESVTGKAWPQPAQGGKNP